MFTEKFIKNTLIGGLIGGIGWAMLVIAFINMGEHEHTVWRLDNPTPWIVSAFFLIPSFVMWLRKD